MKLPHYIAGASLGLALAACSGAQNGATPMIPNGAGTGGGITHYSVPAEHFADAHKASTPLIIVANVNIGLGGSIREYAESANGNVAATTVISHINGPYAVAFSSTEGIGIANGNVASGAQAAIQTFGLAGDLLTGISCFPRPSQTNAVAFDSTGRLFVTAALPEGGRTIDVFAPGANGCATPERKIADYGGLAIDSNNVLYVATRTRPTIDIFPSGSSMMEAQIGGSKTGLQAPNTVAVDASRNVYVFDTATATISEFAAGATGNVAPIRTIAGSKTGLSGGNGFSFGLAVSKASGKIFVSNPGTNAILGFAATASGNVAPTQTIAGSATGLGDPLGVALAE
jgi:hypothetical protein